jgi:hypothetical protein
MLPLPIDNFVARVSDVTIAVVRSIRSGRKAHCSRSCQNHVRLGE